jgi:hypothetical protein
MTKYVRWTMLLVTSSAFCLLLLSLPRSALADPVTIQQCIGDVGPGRCYSEVNYDCAFAHANPSTTDTTACTLTCAKRGADVVACVRLDVHGGGNCGYIVDSVVFSN